MKEPLYQIRQYGEKLGDYQMVNEWWLDHAHGTLPETLLPPSGFILERDGVPVCAAWLYESVGIGVAFLEWVIASPTESLGRSRDNIFQLIEFIKLHARSADYGVVWCNTIPSIARYARKCGFKKLPMERVSMILRTEI